MSRDDLLVRHGTTSFSDAFIDEGERSRARARRSQSGPGFFASQISESESLSKQYYTNHKFTQSPLKRVGALDVLVPQERWHGLRLPEVVLLLHV